MRNGRADFARARNARCERVRRLSGERHRNIAGLVSGLQVVDSAVGDLNATAGDGLDDFRK